MIICRECGSPQEEGTLFCNECGRYLAEASGKTTIVLPFSDFAQHAPQPPLAGFKPEPFVDPLSITFVIPSSRRRFKIAMLDQIRIGRPDSASGIMPELSLAEDKAAEMGVSRMHAVIQASNQGLVLIDLGSTNGTLLNNSPLSPQLPYPLKNGDEIRFGDLLVHILF
jgi:hypothetical protein